MAPDGEKGDNGHDFVVGKDIDFEYSIPVSLSKPALASNLLEASLKKKRTKRKRTIAVPRSAIRTQKQSRTSDSFKCLSLATSPNEAKPLATSEKAESLAQVTTTDSSTKQAAGSAKNPECDLDKKTSEEISGSRIDDNIWETSVVNERQRIREFWKGLSKEKQSEITTLNKEEFLEKFRNQRHVCSCSICGQRRNTAEQDLEDLYRIYYCQLSTYCQRLSRNEYIEADEDHILPSDISPLCSILSPEAASSAATAAAIAYNHESLAAIASVLGLNRELLKRIANRGRKRRQHKNQSEDPLTNQLLNSSLSSHSSGKFDASSRPLHETTYSESLPGSTASQDGEHEHIYDELPPSVLNDLIEGKRNFVDGDIVSDLESALSYLKQRVPTIKKALADSAAKQKDASETKTDTVVPLEDCKDDRGIPGASSTAVSTRSTLAGGILSVADDLLENEGKRFLKIMEELKLRPVPPKEEFDLWKNEGKRFMDLMEQISAHRDKTTQYEVSDPSLVEKLGESCITDNFKHMLGQSEIKSQHKSPQSDENLTGLGDNLGNTDADTAKKGTMPLDQSNHLLSFHDANLSGEEDYTEYNQEYVDVYKSPDYDQNLSYSNDEEQDNEEEAQQVLNLFAARLFEQRVLQAYREHVAKLRQRKLLEELDEENQNDERSFKSKRKAEKQALKAQREAERARVEREKQERLEKARLEAERLVQQEIEAEKQRAEAHRKEIEARMERLKRETEEQEARRAAEAKGWQSAEAETATNEESEKRLEDNAGRCKNEDKPTTIINPTRTTNADTQPTSRSSRMAASNSQVKDRHTKAHLEGLGNDTQEIKLNGRAVTATVIFDNNPVEPVQFVHSNTKHENHATDMPNLNPATKQEAPSNSQTQTNLKVAASHHDQPSDALNTILNSERTTIMAQSDGERNKPQLIRSLPLRPGSTEFWRLSAKSSETHPEGMRRADPLCNWSSTPVGRNSNVVSQVFLQPPRGGTAGWSPFTSTGEIIVPSLPYQNALSRVPNPNFESPWRRQQSTTYPRQTPHSLERIRQAAIEVYTRMIMQGEHLEGFVPSQFLFNRTRDYLGEPFVTQNDVYAACGFIQGDLLCRGFECVRDHVDLVSHIRYTPSL